MPLYFRAALRLQQLITDGDLASGDRLPNESELAERLRASRPTVRRAVSHLVEQGVLVRRRGAGVRVAAPRLRHPAEPVDRADDRDRTDAVFRTEVRSLVVGTVSPDAAARSGLPEGTAVTTLERLRHAGDEPLALLTTIVPREVLVLEAAMLRDCDCDCDGDGDGDGDLGALLRDAGHGPVSGTQVVGARAASADEAVLLDEPLGAPVLTVTRTAWDDRGRLVASGLHVHRASRYGIEFDLGVGRAVLIGSPRGR